MLRRVARALAGQAQRASTQQAPGALVQDVGLGPSTSAPASGSVLSNIMSYLGSSMHAVDPFAGQFVRTKYTYQFKRTGNTPGLVFWKPTTPSLRHKISLDFEALGVYTGAPVPELSMRVQNTGGRNSFGRITARGRGGGAKKIVRHVDFARTTMEGVPGVVERLEHDPNRTAFLALVRYQPEGVSKPVLKYHLAPAGLKPGDVMLSGEKAPLQPGNVHKLRDIPLGMPIHNIELVPGKGGVMGRAAGMWAVIQLKQEKNAVVKLPSGEIRLVDLNCRATIGEVSNALQKLTNLGKAGESRRLGRRPMVRGIAMNPIDHPHGGRTNGGRPSCTPWGVYCKGQRTRLRNKWSNSMILTRKGGQPMIKFVQAKKWRARAELERKAKSGGSERKALAPPDQVLLAASKVTVASSKAKKAEA